MLRYIGQKLDCSFVVSMLVRTVVHKGGEKEYVVMKVQPHPSIVITHLGYVVPEGGSNIYSLNRIAHMREVTSID